MTTRAQRRAAAAELRDQREEFIAPAAQRKPVLDANGDIIRGPLVERAGGTAGFFVRSNPLRALWVRSQTRAAKLDRATLITDAHLACAERLLRAWIETADGITVSPAPFMAEHINAGGSGGSLTAGAVILQIAQAEEWRAARSFLGNDLWRPIHHVVLIGIPVKTWAISLQWDEKFAMGYLVCSLDRLVAFYDERMPNRRRKSDRLAVVGPEIVPVPEILTSNA